MKTITRNPDGSVTVKVETVQIVDGQQVTNCAQWEIQPAQVSAHRLDKKFIDDDANPATLAKLNDDAAKRDTRKN